MPEVQFFARYHMGSMQTYTHYTFLQAKKVDTLEMMTNAVNLPRMACISVLSSPKISIAILIVASSVV